MEVFYLVLIILLFFLAFSDLVVGVANDAVNFLNSAVGSRVAGFTVIMIVASLGILVGATFSSGMMEVARKGIFHPQYFYFNEIMLIFLAVMITDVILLDTFNTYGMPTSTTVSIVFELLGAAVAISLIKVMNDPNALALGEYINSGKALAIISGILLSVVVAFSVGAIVQYLGRSLFSFNYRPRLRYLGGLWGGLSLAAITYFLIVKGASGASFMTPAAKEFLGANTWRIMLGTFAGSAVVLQLLAMFTRFDIMKFIVLVGTFALAMAFAGNDLVNFIGVPLAGLESFRLFRADQALGPDGLLMSGLSGKVQTPTYMLLVAGAVMAATLWLSKKARSVVKTSLDLSRQDEGYERFQPNLFSRSIVRNFSSTTSWIGQLFPDRFKETLARQFDQTPFIEQQRELGDEAPSFDLVRASVILLVASILISLGTAFKLPLSTTYVTFMVAMGASLADGAWGRESAVYRVSGVMSVVGGWFFTAFTAFSIAFVLAFLFHYGGMVAIALLLVLAVALVIRSHRRHDRLVEEQRLLEELYEGEFTRARGIELSTGNVEDVLGRIGDMLDEVMKGMKQENLNRLNKTYKSYKTLKKDVFKLKDNYGQLFNAIDESQLDYGYYYIIVVDYLLEITHCFEYILTPCLDHVDNHHKPFSKAQFEELKQINDEVKRQLSGTIAVFRSQDAARVHEVIDSLKPFFKMLKQFRKSQIKRIKAQEVGVRNSNLYFNVLAEYRDMALFCTRLVKVWYNLVIEPPEDESGTLATLLQADPGKRRELPEEPGE